MEEEEPAMSATTAPLGVEQPPAEVEAAYLEYRRACYAIVHRHAERRGVIAALHRPQTVESLARALDVADDRRRTLSLLLAALERFGSVSRTGDGGYVAVDGFRQPEDLDRSLIAAAIGADKVEQLIHGDNYAGVVDTLFEDVPSVAADFTDGNEKLWDEFLQAPYYRYSRLRAVDAIAATGHSVADLACGPGFGVLELLEAVGAAGHVVGAEISTSFLRAAAHRTENVPNVHLVRADLDRGLPLLADTYFDGAMIVGAYHFLARPEQLFATAARVLKPGGRLCVAYVLCTTDAYDQELMTLRFHLRRPPSYPPKPSSIRELATSHGFAELPGQFWLGSWGWFLFQRG
jgi:SAM-dependent methyltransferase